MACVLLITRDSELRIEVADILAALRYHARFAWSAAEAFASLGQTGADAVFIDASVPDDELAAFFAERARSVLAQPLPVVVIAEAEAKSIDLGATTVLTRPLHPANVNQAIRLALGANA